MKWLKHGRLSKCSSFIINKHKYYLEEVKLQDYREAFAAYKKIIEEAYRYGRIIDIKYDLYDWTITYIQFEDTVIGIKLYRPMFIIQLVQSEQHMQIQTMEVDNPLS